MTAPAFSPSCSGEPAWAGGVRLPWEQVPDWLRAEIAGRLGGQVVSAATQPGGFSPGAAVRVQLSDGRRAFVKAVGAELNPDSPGIYRAEARFAAALPAGVPAPGYLGCVDSRGWVALLFEDVEGVMPAQPWRRAQLDQVLAAMAGLARALTPAPVAAPTAAELHGRSFRGFRMLAGLAASAARDGGSTARADSGLSGVDSWTREHLSALAHLEAGWEHAAAGSTLAHGDVRADNILLAGDRVVFVDWPWACRAAPWFDLVLMLPSIRMQGGPPPERILAAHPAAAGADRDAVTATVAALAGYLLYRSRQPAPPGLPTVRAFQAAQGKAAVAWLKQRTGWR
ncbi:MAG TPA: phosphotransferase [Streptosporangiaceae bacterium]|nr:phosphotransferase [Streptosporangiaceae bacterium]